MHLRSGRNICDLADASMILQTHLSSCELICYVADTLTIRQMHLPIFKSICDHAMHMQSFK